MPDYDYDSSADYYFRFTRDFVDPNEAGMLSMWINISWNSDTHEFREYEFEVDRVLANPSTDVSLNETAEVIQDFRGAATFENCSFQFGFEHGPAPNYTMYAFPHQVEKLIEKLGELVEMLRRLVVVPGTAPTTQVVAVPIPGAPIPYWRRSSYCRRGTCVICIESGRFKRSITCNTCNVLICMKCFDAPSGFHLKKSTAKCPMCRSK